MDKTFLNMSQNNSSSCFSRFFFTFFLSVLLLNPLFGQTTPAAAPAAAADPAVQQGEALFKKAGCNTCHAIDKKVVGPALKDVTKRWQSQADLISFIRNSQKLIAAGHPRATALFQEYKGLQMPAHEFLTEDEVKSILAYIQAAPAPVVVDEKDPRTPTSPPGEQAGGNSTLILALIIIVLVLVLVALVLVLVFIRRYLKDKEETLLEDEKELAGQKIEYGKFFRSPGFIGLVVFIFACVAIRSCWVGALSIGVEQNYAPKQPIPFSHKLHAGQYKIDCNYCHTGVRKSAKANIPSINICMNCHSQIKEGPKFGEAGIAILLEHYEKQTPIEWVRVHNLPDFAYFNHSQHVQVGGIECQTCHGPVEEMEVVKQFSPLTMGWCINCHRETKVNGKDNAYYDKLYAKHKELTVENIGGLECAKCHY